MEPLFRRIMSGQANGAGAGVLRGILRVLEPFYAAVVASRNSSYNSGVLRTHRAARPVISVGNITTGGTGKTPVARWLAEKLRERGHRPAILMRGYKAAPGAMSDEQQLLHDLLNPPGSPLAPIPVHANPNRVEGASEIVRDHPEVSVILLDDGFQHRKLHRNFDLVLIDSTNPFGYEHTLPRGLLREPMRNLSRAHAVLLTRVNQALPDELAEIESQVRSCAPRAPIYRSVHAQAAVVCDEPGGTRVHGIPHLHGKRIFAFCGIGNPDAFERQLRSTGATIVGHRSFGDHHQYDESDLRELRAAARDAEALVTTEKDWVKIARLAKPAAGLPIWRVRLDLKFVGDDEQRLLDQILLTLKPANDR